MPKPIETITHPELIFGIAGPIGVNVDLVQQEISKELVKVGYTGIDIKLTDELFRYCPPTAKPKGQNFFDVTIHKIQHANRVCRENEDASFMARLAIWAILRERGARSGKFNKVLNKTAFILRQLKRKDEVDLLRKVYGKQFVLVSAYGSIEERTQCISNKLTDTMPTNTKSTDVASRASQLIAQDASEDEDPFGQDMRDTFHRGDVFVDGITADKTNRNISRFVEAFFGRTSIAPSKIEYGMYAAKSASLRSSDLSRQVGVAIFSAQGELITQGCNEVPKAKGGTYWDLETPDYRDVKLGRDPNDSLKKRILRELFERLLD